jgi:hypothetical protein
MYRLCNCFLKFVIHELVKSEMVVLTGREKTDVVDTDVAVN